MTDTESANPARERILAALRAEDQDDFAQRLADRIEKMKQARG